MRAQFLRFVALGATNTLLTGALLVLLAHLMPFPVAYAICYALGLTIAVFATGRVVFGADLTGPRAAKFLALYLSIYAFGLLVGHFADSVLGFGPTGKSITVLATTAPLNFLAGRLVFAA